MPEAEAKSRLKCALKHQLSKMQIQMYSRSDKVLVWGEKIVNYHIGESIGPFTVLHHDERSNIFGIDWKRSDKAFVLRPKSDNFWNNHQCLSTPTPSTKYKTGINHLIKIRMNRHSTKTMCNLTLKSNHTGNNLSLTTAIMQRSITTRRLRREEKYSNKLKKLWKAKQSSHNNKTQPKITQLFHE